MITIYKTPGCYVCGKVIQQLTTANVPHEVIDLSQDPEALAYVKGTLGAEAAPVIVDSNDPNAWWCGPNPLGVAALIASYGATATDA